MKDWTEITPLRILMVILAIALMISLLPSCMGTYYLTDAEYSDVRESHAAVTYYDNQIYWGWNSGYYYYYGIPHYYPWYYYYNACPPSHYHTSSHVVITRPVNRPHTIIHRPNRPNRNITVKPNRNIKTNTTIKVKTNRNVKVKTNRTNNKVTVKPNRNRTNNKNRSNNTNIRKPR